MRHFKRIAAVLAALSVLLCASAGAAGAVSLSDLPEEERDLSEYLADDGIITDIECGYAYDPGAGRLGGSVPEGFADGADGIEEHTGELPLEGGVPAASSPFKTGSYYHTAHPDSAVLHGVDVSSYQETIDWKKAKAAGVEFAIIRAGYRGYGASGTVVADAYCKTNLENAKAAGVKVGAYFYSQAINEKEAAAEAEYAIARLGGAKLDLPIVYDFEYAEPGGSFGGRLYNAKLTTQQKTDLCLAFCETVEKAGYQGMVYSSKSMFANELYTSQITAKYPIWLAHYTTDTNYSGEFDFWQYTSSGTVSGMPGPIDCDFWYITIPPTDIKLSDAELTLEACDTAKLTATLSPDGAMGAIEWTSSDESVAVVDGSGSVTGVAPGTAFITASVGKLSDTCKVTVTEPTVVFSFSTESVTLYIGDKTTVTASAAFVDGDALPVTLRIADPAIASVDEKGVVTGLKNGSTRLIASAEGKTAFIPVTVKTYLIPFTTNVRLVGPESYKFSDFTFKLVNSAAPSASCEITSSAAEFGFKLDFSLPKTAHSLTISRPGYTSYVDNSFLPGTDAMPSVLNLYGGDVNGDGYINSKDFAVLRTLTGGSAKNGDFDLNGKVDAADEKILLDNFGKKGTVRD